MSVPPTQTVLLTGATGFIGRELLWRLARVPANRILCLVRARDAADATRRIDEILDQSQPSPLSLEERSRVRAIAGDLTRDKCGLSPSSWDELASTVNRVLHGAASVDWAAPLEDARRINLEGTRRIVELAQAAQSRGVLSKFDYLGTTHVCGKRSGPVPEQDLDDRHGFFNSYERSKFEAEQLVRSSGLPYCTFRLSMVVGDSKTGYASTFRVMYWPLKMLARGLALPVPADRRGIVDLVPVDYVCDAIETLSADPKQRRKTFHLAAGPGCSSTVGEVLALAVKRFRVRPPLLVPPNLFDITIRPVLLLVVWGKRRSMMQKGRIYRPYFAFRASFDTTQTRAALEPLGIRPPLVEDYFQQLVDYAIASDWGKRPV